MLSVPDLDAAYDAYSGMGFRLSPRAEHDTLGTANHVFVFAGTYCELLGIVRPEQASRSVGGALAAGSGVTGLALCGSADEAKTDYAERGIVAEDAVEFSRAAHVDGEVGTARFRISKLADGTAPGFFSFICEHRTPKLVWHADAVAHPNGVTGIVQVLVRADDPAKAAAPYERIRSGSVLAEGGVYSVDLGPRLRFQTPSALAERYPGLNLAGPASEEGAGGAGAPATDVDGVGVVFSTVSLPRAVACLAEGGIEYASTRSGSVYIVPEHACGVLVELVDAQEVGSVTRSGVYPPG